MHTTKDVGARTISCLRLNSRAKVGATRSTVSPMVEGGCPLALMAGRGNSSKEKQTNVVGAMAQHGWHLPRCPELPGVILEYRGRNQPLASPGVTPRTKANKTNKRKKKYMFYTYLPAPCCLILLISQSSGFRVLEVLEIGPQTSQMQRQMLYH